jgi:hypothetical protein
MFYPAAHPAIEELGRPELKLAGVRIDPEINGRSRMTSHCVALSLVAAGTLVPTPPDSDGDLRLDLPDGLNVQYVSWSPDSRHVAFTTLSPGKPGGAPREPLQLWVADAASGATRPLMGDLRLNSIFEDYSWLDANTIVATVIDPARGEAPTEPPVGAGPIIISSLSSNNLLSLLLLLKFGHMQQFHH